MKAAFAQFDIVWEDREGNFRKVDRFLEEGRDLGVDLLVLPELFALGFTMNAGKFVEDESGPTVSYLSRAARSFGIHIIGGSILHGPGRPRNVALLHGPDGSLLGRYDKIHPFSFGDEDKHYDPGDSPLVIEALGFNVLITICYDLRFPELYRAGLDRGADLIVVIANWPIEREAHWRFLAQGRAIDNLSYLVACNRTGIGGGLTYPGASLIVDPTGTVLADGAGEETLCVADLNPRMVEKTRRKFPFLRDRKRDLYRKWIEEDLS